MRLIAAAAVPLMAVLVAGMHVSSMATGRGSSETAHTQASLEASGVVLDHVPIAVADLPAAIRLWQDTLGFSIKPGRLHPNSIDNAHIKFPDGTAIELITASRPSDELAIRYLDLLGRHDGPAFLALRPDSFTAVASLFETAAPGFAIESTPYSRSLAAPSGEPLGYLFFIELLSPPVDRPEQLEHANTAGRLHAVWLRGSGFDAELRLFAALGLPVRPAAIRLPDSPKADEVGLRRGSLYLAHDETAKGGRPIFGITLAVADLRTTGGWLRAAGVNPVAGEDARGRWLRVEPGRASGTWVEFLELRH